MIARPNMGIIADSMHIMAYKLRLLQTWDELWVFVSATANSSALDKIYVHAWIEAMPDASARCT